MRFNRLLISGLGGSLFPYLHNKLIQVGYEIYYVDNNKNLSNIYPDLNFFLAPRVTDSSYSNFIDELIIKFNIDVYIPLIDEELIFAKEKETTFSYKKLVVLTPDNQFSKLCLNKDNLMASLSSLGISEIETYSGDKFEWQFTAPVFVKPISGRGSRGIMKINTQAELDAYYILEKYKHEEVIIQPYIEGIEYTVGVVVNQENQLISISSKKVLSKKGITIAAVTVNNDSIDKVSKRITQKLKPMGPFNIQLFITPDNKIKIFEINPRFSTTLVLSYEAGLDEITLYLKNLNDYQDEVKHPKENLSLYRLWNNYFY